jgi:hypothetical protein
VSQTALLREVLSRDHYHVLHFDLRIAGFADLASLYMSLSQQMEMYFETISQTMDGYEDFEKEAWGFKVMHRLITHTASTYLASAQHDRIDVEKRISDAPSDSRHRNVKTSDIARLMELFQSSLLKYWEFRPEKEEGSESNDGKKRKRDDPDNASERTQVEGSSRGSKQRSRFTLPRSWRTKPRDTPRIVNTSSIEGEKAKEDKYPKKVPVRNRSNMQFAGLLLNLLDLGLSAGRSP